MLACLACVNTGCERIFLADDCLKILEVEGGRVILLKTDAQYLAPLTVEGAFPASKWTSAIFVGNWDDTKFEEGELWSIYRTGGSIRDFRQLERGEMWIGEKSWRIKLKFQKGSDMLLRLNGTHQAEHIGRALPPKILEDHRPVLGKPLKELLDLAATSTETFNVAGLEIPLADLIMSLVKSDAFYAYAWHGKPRDKTWEKMNLWGHVYVPTGGLRGDIKEIYKFEDEKRESYIAWCKKNLRGDGYLRGMYQKEPNEKH